jgi:hypothetical protein
MLFSGASGEAQARVAGKILPAAQRMSDPLWSMIREAGRNDENSGVEIADLKPGEGETKEVVAISSHKNPALNLCEAELILI